jgi:hypothetical protein
MRETPKLTSNKDFSDKDIGKGAAANSRRVERLTPGES